MLVFFISLLIGKFIMKLKSIAILLSAIHLSYPILINKACQLVFFIKLRYKPYV